MKDIFLGFSENPFEGSWFPYPNELVAYWPMLKHRELLALNYILRHTIGFKKTSDSISYSQFLHGVGNLDSGCGIKSSSTLKLALDGLIDKGFITKEGGTETGKTNHYSLVHKNKTGLQNPNTSPLDTKAITSSETKDTINNSINNNQYINNELIINDSDFPFTDEELDKLLPSRHSLIELPEEILGSSQVIDAHHIK